MNTSFTQIGEYVINKKMKDGFRVVAFNVHYFCDFNGTPQIKNIFKVLDDIDADVVFLQETFLFNKRDKERFDKFVLKSRYKFSYMCNKYGINTFLSKKKLENILVINLGSDRFAISCMINGFQIIGTHLDVYDNTEITRCTQMDIIMKHINSAYAIILGDLNSLRIEDYSPKEWNEILQIDKNRGIVTKTDLVKKIEKNGFIDSFVFSEKIPPKITVWSGRRVDYIFIKTNKKIKIETDVVKTVCSDHYPIYVDLPKKID